MHKPGALLLAAGKSTRTGRFHKLLAEFEGIPLVRRSALTLIHSDVGPVTVITGHRDDEIRSALRGLPLTIIFNARYSEGLGESLSLGVAQPSIAKRSGVLVMLADMPDISSHHINILMEAFRDSEGGAVVRAGHNNATGHPVILPKILYPQLLQLNGDSGAQRIIETSGIPIRLCQIGIAAVYDADTAEDIARTGGRLCR